MAVLVALAVVLGIAVLVIRSTLLVVRVGGESMAPALAPGASLLARRRRGTGPVRRGDVVVTTLPVDDSRYLPYQGLVVKRVTAVPGDAVPPEVRAAAGVDIVPAGMVVLRGDNYAVSFDSRFVGLFALNQVRGVVLRPLRGRERLR